MLLAFYSHGQLDFGAFAVIDPQFASGQVISHAALILMFNDCLGRRRHVECLPAGDHWDAHIVVESPEPSPGFPQSSAQRKTAPVGRVEIIPSVKIDTLSIRYSFDAAMLGATVDFSPMPERFEGVITLSRGA